MLDKIHNLYITCISSGRPFRVKRCLKQYPPFTFYVKPSDVKLYQACGARNIVAVDGTLVDQRNKALEDAWNRGAICVQLDDDLKKIGFAKDNQNKHVEKTTVESALDYMLFKLRETNFKLAGKAPTANAYYYRKEITTKSFVISQMMMIRSCDVKFDPLASGKEDYDYTLQHIEKYGGVCRCDKVLAEFDVYKAPGGLQQFRTGANQKALVDYLLKKWKGKLFPNAKRPGEVLIRWPN